jgi:hypothetical protein
VFGWGKEGTEQLAKGNVPLDVLVVFGWGQEGTEQLTKGNVPLTLRCGGAPLSSVNENNATSLQAPW